MTDKYRIKFRIIGFLSLISHILSAQEAKSSLQIGSDFVSNYVWRGILYDGSPNIQPNLSFSSRSGNFVIGSWGSFSFSNPYKETDLYSTVTVGKFSISVWDYFTIPAEGNVNYFHYDNKTTLHAFEGSVVFNGFDEFPLRLTMGTFFYGNDRNPDTHDNYYSTYLEAAYPIKVGSQKLLLLAGGTPSEGLYASKRAITNVGINLTKNIRLTDQFSVPLTGILTFNPESEQIFFVISINISSND
jgi:hypothetical protein